MAKTRQTQTAAPPAATANGDTAALAARLKKSRSAEMRAAMEKRRETIGNSAPQPRWLPPPGVPFTFRMTDVSFAVPEYDGKKVEGTDYLIKFVVADPTHEDDGRDFSMKYRIRPPKKGKDNRSVAASQIIELLGMAYGGSPEEFQRLTEGDDEGHSGEELWDEAFVEVIGSGILYRGVINQRSYKDAKGADATGFDLRVFGEAAGSHAADAGDAAEEAAEGEEGAEAGEEEAAEGEEEAIEETAAEPPPPPRRRPLARK